MRRVVKAASCQSGELSGGQLSGTRNSYLWMNTHFNIFNIKKGAYADMAAIFNFSMNLVPPLELSKKSILITYMFEEAENLTPYR